MGVVIELGDHGDGLVQLGEVASRHRRLDPTEELQRLASQRQVEAERDLVPEHAGDGLRVHQIAAVVWNVLGRLLERATVPAGAWLVDDLVAVLVQHLCQAAWRALVNPGL